MRHSLAGHTSVLETVLVSVSVPMSGWELTHHNVAKYHIRLSRKKADRIFKKKTNKLKVADGAVDGGIIEKLSKDDEVEKEASTEVASERMCIDEAQEGPPKKMPIVREGKLRRTELPLQFCVKQKGNERTDKVKPKAA
uniref:Uncharacterized protein n=1 Tax=Ascaris lumbricoides TaxID=6252 RepID=A0A9J2PDF5_ASCLU